MLNWFACWFGEKRSTARPSGQAAPSLRLEELEPRLVPSTSPVHPSTATNWAGYDIITPKGAVTAVSGTWTVPAVTGTVANPAANPKTLYSDDWVGIDGDGSNTVEQLGTESDWDAVNGKPIYFAWYEMAPSPWHYVTLTVNPGDRITASVTFTGNGKFTLSMTDLDDTTDKTNIFSVVQTASNARRVSAEWIVEAPWSNGVLPLANFGTTTFTSATATIGGHTGVIDDAYWASAHYTVYSIDMVTSAGATKASTGALTTTNGTEGFTVTFVSSGLAASTRAAAKSASPVANTSHSVRAASPGDRLELPDGDAAP